MSGLSPLRDELAAALDEKFDRVEDREYDEDDDSKLPSLQDVLRSLPLVEFDHYIGMQAMNLAIVARMLKPLEDGVAGEYFVTDRLPIEQFMGLSALTQLWIFGVYEFLRTWRGWVEEVIDLCDELDLLDSDTRATRIKQQVDELQRQTPSSMGGKPYAQGFALAAVDSAYRQQLLDAWYRSDLSFGKVEALRVHLAKHEVPKSKKGDYGSGAGYARIDLDRSLMFMVPLGNHEVINVTRRGIERDLRRMADGRLLLVISRKLQEAIKPFRKTSYGHKRVRMTLDDGTVLEGVIGWGRHIAWVKGDPEPFDAAKVVALEQLGDEGA